MACKEHNHKILQAVVIKLKYSKLCVTFLNHERVSNVTRYPLYIFKQRGEGLSEDNLIMGLVKDGDREAFEALVLKHRMPAVRFAQKYVGDEYIAEDIVQDSFAIIYIKRMEYKPKHSFKTFLYTVIRNKCIDYLRKQKNVSIDEVELYTPSAEEVVVDREERSRAAELLRSLNNEYQRALYLFEYEDMSYKEIAKVMNKTVAQVKITIFRARKKIMKAVEEELNAKR